MIVISFLLEDRGAGYEAIVDSRTVSCKPISDKYILGLRLPCAPGPSRAASSM